MESIGQSLREAREERGISLSEVQRISKIRRSYLEALEDGSFSALPGEAYHRAFIRTYAAAIGMDPQPFTARYDNLRQEERRVQEAEVQRPEPSTPLKVMRRILTTLNGTMEWLGL